MRKLLQLLTFLLLLIVMRPSEVMAQQRNISGTVVTENQSPLTGVTIAVKKTNRITQTDVNGHYSIPAATGETLVLSYVGYDPQELKVNNSSIFDFTMRTSGSNLNEVVVTALG